MAVVATTAHTSTTFCGYEGITASRVRFIIGGSNTADVQVYHPASNTWDNSGPDLPGPRPHTQRRSDP